MEDDDGSTPPLNKRAKKDGSLSNDDHLYFGSYADIGIHHEMIADRARTVTYRLAILKNFEKIRGKVVMDVGAGTGILSIFCVHAGARKVYAIEASAMAKQAELVIKENSMEDRITVINSKVEEVDLPEKVDVIVSEWMGYFLLFETMLPSVLFARDKWLKQDGIMLPSEANIYLAPINCQEEYEDRLALWGETEMKYEVKMTSLIPFARHCMTRSVQVCEVEPEDVIAHAASIAHLDLLKVTTEDLKSVESKFNFKCFGSHDIHGYTSWFSVKFPCDIVLSTSPYERLTHWQQAVMYIEKPIHVEQDTTITGSIKLSPNQKYNRYLDVRLNYQIGDEETTVQQLILCDQGM